MSSDKEPLEIINMTPLSEISPDVGMLDAQIVLSPEKNADLQLLRQYLGGAAYAVTADIGIINDNGTTTLGLKGLGALAPAIPKLDALCAEAGIVKPSSDGLVSNYYNHSDVEAMISLLQERARERNAGGRQKT